jgi:mannose-6-phosphate isomerase
MDDQPIAEAWFGTHRTGGSDVEISARKTIQLNDFVMGNVDKHLGKISQRKFGKELPFLMKLLAVSQSLSIQAHPTSEQAQKGFAEEEKDGIRIADPLRSFKDPNPKPELFVALQKSYIFNGFLPADEILETIADLRGKLVEDMRHNLKLHPDEEGVRECFENIMKVRGQSDQDTELSDTLANIKSRVDSDLSNNLLQDKLMLLVADDHPNDPMVLTLLMMNAMELNAYDAAFVPEGRVHVYVRGFGVEVMINSDNVLRAGLTEKHVNDKLFLEIANFSPSGRLSPVRALVDGNMYDYRSGGSTRLGVNLGELSEKKEKIEVYPQGPRMVICLNGKIVLHNDKGKLALEHAQAAFISDVDGPVTVTGDGRFVLSYVELD